MAEMSNNLRRLLADWLDWAEGNGDQRRYSPEYGLCYAILYSSGKTLNFSVDDRHRMLEELRGCLIKEFNDAEFPFHGGDGERYVNDDNQHENPARLAWVRAKVAE